MDKTLFLDTNVLLQEINQFKDQHFVIASTTLRELEDIKTNRNKTEQVRSAARCATRFLSENPDKYEVCHYPEAMNVITEMGLGDSPDSLICANAFLYNKKQPVKFITHDISCRNIAGKILGLDVEWFSPHRDTAYTGFKEIIMSDEEMAHFYENMSENDYGVLLNEYLIIKNKDYEPIDAYRWNGSFFDPMYKKSVKSIYFDKLKPKDIYQSCVIDSIMNNTITAISGKAGSGKTLISLVTIMNLIENGKYDRFVCLFNPVKARGTADLGFYAGDFLSKAMLNSVGNILTTKFGDRYAIDLLLSQNKIKLVSMADCRGMEITDSEILYIPEAENTSVDLVKLCLSRVSSGAKVIIEGDPESQVDSYLYEGHNNGLARVIDAFKGQSEFGYIQLQNIWRSKIAELCELL